MGIKEIDEQHKTLFQIGAEAAEFLTNESEIENAGKIEEVLCKLKKYAQYHFSFEEELIWQYGYEHYAEHCEEHEYYILQMDVVKLMENRIPQRDTLAKIVKFLSEWILNHILETDTRYITTVNSKAS